MTYIHKYKYSYGLLSSSSSHVMLLIPTFDDYFPLLRSSGPVSYGYSELENNNPSSVTSAMVGDVSLQTPGLEYSAPSFKREIVVSEGNLIF